MTDFPQPSFFPRGARFSDGVWSQTLSPLETTQGRPALFLDRDGVVVEEAHYLHDSEKVHLTTGAANLIKIANDKNIPVILVTNQAGIGYGYFEWDAFVSVQAQILSDLAHEGAHLDGVFACPFHAKGQGVYAHDNHPARKPNPGMLILARERMGVDLSASWIVGDRALDVAAGKNAGCLGGIHVGTGHGSKAGERDAALALADTNYTVKTAANLSAARPYIAVLNEPSPPPL